MNKQIREYTLEDGTVINQRVYETELMSFWCPEKSCAFCKYCHDIWYDTDGPYMFACEKEEELQKTDPYDTHLTALGYEGKCDAFEEDEDIEWQNEEHREARRIAMELMQNEEAVTSFRKAMIEYFDEMFSGLTDITAVDLGEKPIN